MKKDYILNEIRRTADKETNQALGEARLEKETGIRRKDWFGIHWAKYSEAVKEAGCKPNEYNKAFEEEWVVKQLIDFIDKKNKFPTGGELRLEKKNNKDFPSHNVFGTKPEMAKKIVEYCEKNNVFPDVLEICRPLCKSEETNITNKIDDSEDEEFGIVYLMLMKARKDYKLGHSGHAGRRNYELGIKMPEKLELIHEIRTDDPVGIENYWKKRFKDKQLRKRAEWYKLTSQDVKAFKRRKFM